MIVLYISICSNKNDNAIPYCRCVSKVCHDQLKWSQLQFSGVSYIMWLIVIPFVLTVWSQSITDTIWRSLGTYINVNIKGNTHLITHDTYNFLFRVIVLTAQSITLNVLK